MNKIILKPGPEPKKLTAKSPMRSLLEHQLAFLNANNKRGFPELDNIADEQVDTVAEKLLKMAKQETVNMKDILDLVHSTVYVKVDEHGEEVKRYAIKKNMISRLLGYYSYASLRYFNKSHGDVVINRANEKRATALVFSKCGADHTTLTKKPKEKAIKQQVKEYSKLSPVVRTTEEYEAYKEVERLLVEFDQFPNIKDFQVDVNQPDHDFDRKIYFNKDSDVFRLKAPNELKVLVDDLWKSLNRHLVLRDPKTGRAVAINKLCSSQIWQYTFTPPLTYKHVDFYLSIKLKNIRIKFIPSNPN